MKRIVLALLIVLAGCANKSEPTVVVDSKGYKYRLVKEAERITDAQQNVELWERIEPLDTNGWYFRALGSDDFFHRIPR